MSSNPKITAPRRPRFQRSGPVALRLQERDIQIFEEVFEHRFLSSRHIIALVTGGEKAIKRRLCNLYHGQYLDRPREQLLDFHPGTTPMVYGLGNRGADALCRHRDVARGRIDWTSKNRNVGTLFLEHTLAVSDIMVNLELACRQRGNVKIIRADEIFTGKAKLRVNTEVRHGDRNWKLNYSLVPDKIFGLHFTDEPEGRNMAYFMVEADRGTMPVIRRNLYKTSFYKKLIGFWDCHKKGVFKKIFGFQNARVLTVTTSKERIKNMVQACKLVDSQAWESGMFLFTTADLFDLGDVDKALSSIWWSGGNVGRSSLLD